jgi:hypothetical protein
MTLPLIVAPVVPLKEKSYQWSAILPGSDPYFQKPSITVPVAIVMVTVVVAPGVKPVNVKAKVPSGSDRVPGAPDGVATLWATIVVPAADLKMTVPPFVPVTKSTLL